MDRIHSNYQMPARDMVSIELETGYTPPMTFDAVVTYILTDYTGQGVIGDRVGKRVKPPYDNIEIRVLDRETGEVVATTGVSPDGHWLVEGLTTERAFDVVARRPGSRDTIWSDVRANLIVMGLVNGLVTNETFDGVDGEVTIKGGLPPFVVSAEGLPEGLYLILSGREIRVGGTSSARGLHSVGISVAEATGVVASIAATILVSDAIPHIRAYRGRDFNYIVSPPLEMGESCVWSGFDSDGLTLSSEGVVSGLPRGEFGTTFKTVYVESIGGVGVYLKLAVEVMPPDVIGAVYTPHLTNNSIVLSIHEDTRPGDLVLVFVMHRSEMVVPAGWVVVDTQVSAQENYDYNQYLVLMSRIFREGDAKTVVVNFVSSGRLGASVITLPGPLRVEKVVGESMMSTSPPIVPMYSVTVPPNSLSIAAASWVYASTTPPTFSTPSEGWTPRYFTTTNESAHQLRLGVASRVSGQEETVSGYFNRSLDVSYKIESNNMTVVLTSPVLQ